MEELNLHKIQDSLIEYVKSIYDESLKHKDEEVIHKELNDIATETDKFMEESISNYLKKNFPNHKIIGEELGENDLESEYEWLIDPIDGTVNFASNIPMFGTSIALRKNHETILGIIFDWPNKKVYTSIKGEGAYLDGKKLEVSERKDLSEAIVTICLTSSYDKVYTDKVLHIIEKLQPHVRGVRIIVCTVYELIWVASGLTDCMINVKPSLGLSSAAGKLMVLEAGGVVTNLRGKIRENVDDLLITNKTLHDELLKIINE